LQLGAWREPQLIELQRQLAEVNLPPLVAQAFREERAGVCHTLETVPVTKLQLFTSGKTQSVWQKLRDPSFWLLNQMPQGSVYENMTTVPPRDQALLTGFGPDGVVQPKLVDDSMNEIQKQLSHFSPATFLAAQVIPNSPRATRTTAYNQTL